MLSILTDFCSYWWLWWVLPFIIGCLLVHTIMKKWRRMYEELHKDMRKLRNRNAVVEQGLVESNKEQKELKGQISILKGKIRELENQNKS